MQKFSRNLRNILLVGVATVAMAGCGAVGPETRPLFQVNAPAGDAKSVSKLHARAVASFNAGHFGNALHDFRMVLQQNPGDVAALNGIAASYDRIGRSDLAATYYERALLYDPKSVQTLNNIGYSYLLQERLDLAYVFLAKAYAAEPGEPRIVSNYEATLAGLNKKPRAKQFAAVAPVLPVESERLPVPGQYRFEQLSARVQRLIAEAPDPGLSAPEHGQRPMRPSEPGRRPTEILIVERPPAARLPDEKQALQLPPLEVSNGTGRSRMAARMGAHLETFGVSVDRLTNAPDFSRGHTTLYYGPSYAEAAEALVKRLPFEVHHLAPSSDGRPLRLELGADLLDYDARLTRGGVATDA